MILALKEANYSKKGFYLKILCVNLIHLEFVCSSVLPYFHVSDCAKCQCEELQTELVTTKSSNENDIKQLKEQFENDSDSLKQSLSDEKDLELKKGISNCRKIIRKILISNVNLMIIFSVEYSIPVTFFYPTSV